MSEAQKRLSRRYVIYCAVASLWFVEAIWLYFYRKYINDQQIGMLDAGAFLIGLIVEIPSGALGDFFGHGRIARLGQVLAAVGIVMQAVGLNFSFIFIGQTILMIGTALISGSDEALFFEKLNFKSGSKHWRNLMMRCTMASTAGFLLAVLFGSWLYGINGRLPFILTGLAFLVSAMLLNGLSDVQHKRDKLLTSLKTVLNDIVIGAKQFARPELRIYVPFILTVQGIVYATNWGMLRLVLLNRFNFSVFGGSVVMAIGSLVAVVILYYLHRRSHKLSEKYLLSAIGFAIVVSLIAAIFNLGFWGSLVVIALNELGFVIKPFMSDTINYHAPSAQRATVLSVASFLQLLPYVILAPLIGTLNQHGQLGWLLAIWAGLIIVAIVFYLRGKRQDSQIIVADI